MTEKLSQPDELKSLGAQKTTYRYTDADASLLEKFPNPMKMGPGHGEVEITAPEFTSLCPKTGQPDFAKIIVIYEPRVWCVESKSLKLYLGSYRNFGEFHESCVRRIANDLIRLLDPETLTVRGEFTPRGGIPFWPELCYSRPKLLLSYDVLQQDEKGYFVSIIDMPRDGREIGFLNEEDQVIMWANCGQLDGKRVRLYNCSGCFNENLSKPAEIRGY